MGLQFGRDRRWRAGIEVEWRAHPGSESGTCFRTNRSCRVVPAHQGMKMGARRWKRLGVSCNAPPPPLDSRPVSGHRAGSSRERRIQGGRTCGLVRRICTADSATPHADPSGGQAPALHFPFPTPGLRPRIGVRGRLVARVTSRESIPDRSLGHAFVRIDCVIRRESNAEW